MMLQSLKNKGVSLKKWGGALLMAVLISTGAQAQTIQAGRDYEVLAKPLAVNNDGKISVVEFFSYGCSHCFDFEAELKPWAKSNANKVNFQSSPVIFPGTRWGEAYFADIFYTLEAMGVLEQYHSLVFNAVQKQRLNFADDKVLGQWLDAQKINAAKFFEVRKSFTVSTQVNRAKKLMEDAGVDSTPQLIVAGKYRVITAGSFKRMLETADALITRESFEAKRIKKK